MVMPIVPELWRQRQKDAWGRLRKQIQYHLASSFPDVVVLVTNLGTQKAQAGISLDEGYWNCLAKSSKQTNK